MEDREQRQSAVEKVWCMLISSLRGCSILYTLVWLFPCGQWRGCISWLSEKSSLWHQCGTCKLQRRLHNPYKFHKKQLFLTVIGLCCVSAKRFRRSERLIEDIANAFSTIFLTHYLRLTAFSSHQSLTLCKHVFNLRASAFSMLSNVIGWHSDRCFRNFH